MVAGQVVGSRLLMKVKLVSNRSVWIRGVFWISQDPLDTFKNYFEKGLKVRLEVWVFFLVVFWFSVCSWLEGQVDAKEVSICPPPIPKEVRSRVPRGWLQNILVIPKIPKNDLPKNTKMPRQSKISQQASALFQNYVRFSRIYLCFQCLFMILRFPKFIKIPPPKHFLKTFGEAICWTHRILKRENN